MQNLQGGQAPAGGVQPPAGGQAPFNPFGAFMQQQPAAPADTRPPAEKYATQLTKLENMGFTNRETNLEVLTAVGGNVNIAVERLLNLLG